MPIPNHHDEVDLHSGKSKKNTIHCYIVPENINQSHFHLSYTWLSLIAGVFRISIVSATNRIWLGRTKEKCMQWLPSYEENIFYQQVYVIQIINQDWWENIGIFKHSEMYKICVLLTLLSKATWGNTFTKWEDKRERESQMIQEITEGVCKQNLLSV